MGLRSGGMLIELVKSRGHEENIYNLITERPHKDDSTESQTSGHVPVGRVVGRRLLSLTNCTPRAVEQFPRDVFSQSEREGGALVVHVTVAVYMFLALAIVCDDYFVPSLELISEYLNIQPDVAGATFMAAGSSAPELATAVIGVFIAKDDVGLSTVVGSAIYNVMFVISVCGFAASAVIHLHWWPMARDCTAYLVSITALILAILDEKVDWYEAVVFLALYCVYCLVMAFNSPLEQLVISRWTCCSEMSNQPPSAACPNYEKVACVDDNIGSEMHALVDRYDDERNEDSPFEGTDATMKDFHKSECDTKPLFQRPKGRIKCLIWAAGLPVSLLLAASVPDCRKPRRRKWFWLTFGLSLVWLSVFSFLLIWMITIIGYSINIADSIMSLTFVAFGVSLPDVVASVLVIKEGFGDMAVSNAVGSNVFDILVCLGLPWCIQTCFIKPGSSVQVYSKGLVYSTCMLLSTVAILLLSIQCNKWRLDKKVSFLFMVVYLTFLLLASLYELNFFGYVHPQECQSNY